MKEFTKVLMFMFTLYCVSSAHKMLPKDSPGPGYNYFEEMYGWMKVHIIPTSFREAFRHCNLEGSELASPFDDRMRNAMMSLLNNATVCEVYTGINSLLAKGVYTTLAGTLLEEIPVKWAPGEPDNFDDKERCLTMREDGCLADVDCSNSYPFICLKLNSFLKKSKSCGNYEPGYTLYPKTRSCYKFHTNPSNWHDAQAICSAEGGHLVVVNSEDEAEVIKELFARHPANTIDTIHANLASVGIFDWGFTGKWLTIHGEQLRLAGYEKWMEGHPDTIKRGNFSCGAISRSALFGGIWCEKPVLPFICEISRE